MLLENTEELSKRYLREELELSEKEVARAEVDLIGFFEVLLRIDERLKSNSA